MDIEPLSPIPRQEGRSDRRLGRMRQLIGFGALVLGLGGWFILRTHLDPKYPFPETAIKDLTLSVFSRADKLEIRVVVDRGSAVPLRSQLFWLEIVPCGSAGCTGPQLWALGDTTAFDPPLDRARSNLDSLVIAYGVVPLGAQEYHAPSRLEDGKCYAIVSRYAGRESSLVFRVHDRGAEVVASRFAVDSLSSCSS